MNLEKLENILKAPKKGTCLIYTRQDVLYEDYDVESVSEYLKSITGEILEIHFFDQDKEYRAIYTESRRREKEGNVIEYISDFKNEPNSVYSERCFLENGENITVLNHISFDEKNGMAYIDDYRLIRG